MKLKPYAYDEDNTAVGISQLILLGGSQVYWALRAVIPIKNTPSKPYLLETAVEKMATIIMSAGKDGLCDTFAHSSGSEGHPA